MIPAFATATQSLFQRLGCEATYHPKTGSPIQTRIILRRPDEYNTFGETRLSSQTIMIDLLLAEIPSPATGDEIEASGRRYALQGTPRRDQHHLVWTVEAHELS